MAKQFKGLREGSSSHPFSAELSLLDDAWRSDLLFTLAKKKSIKDEGMTFIAIDEVGRGCLAGPIVVCASLWKASAEKFENPIWLNSLRDSKKLSALKRDVIFKQISESTKIHGLVTEQSDRALERESCIGISLQEELKQANQLLRPSLVSKFTEQELKKIACSKSKLAKENCSLIEASIGSASASCIDHCGIVSALGVAASQALARLTNLLPVDVILFDGNRPLPLTAPWAEQPQILITKGDDLLKSISTSSVVAKVVRDQWMENYSQYFPQFALDENKGYGTESHRLALARLGPSPLHRTSFLKNICPEL